MKIKDLFVPSQPIEESFDDVLYESESLCYLLEQINEIASQGDYRAIGIMELSAFYAKASDMQKKQLQALIQQKDVKGVWDLVYQVTGMRI